MSMREAVLGGRPIDWTPFIDVHGHFGPWADTAVPWCMDGGRLVAEMDRYGCDMVWMCASDPGYAAPMRIKNDIVFRLAETYPTRIVPYCTLSANEPDRCLDELNRCIERCPCIGVKMHRYDQPHYTLKSAFLQPVLEKLSERKLVYLNHCFEDIEDLLWASNAYPGATFVAGHYDPRIVQAAGQSPNIFDCTCAAQMPDQVGYLVKNAGSADRLMVGSDFGLFNLGFGIGMVAFADICEEDKDRILGLNAVDILRRQPWFSPRMLACTRS